MNGASAPSSQSRSPRNTERFSHAGESFAQHRVLVEMVLELPGHADAATIILREGEAPMAVAERFCSANGLDLSISGVLAQELQQRVEGDGTIGARNDMPAVEEKGGETAQSLPRGSAAGVIQDLQTKLRATQAQLRTSRKMNRLQANSAQGERAGEVRANTEMQSDMGELRCKSQAGLD